mgnify:CR=1 FL=1
MKNYLSKLPEYWCTSNNKKISCQEKIKILNDNIEELQNLANDILDEAILMGVDKSQYLNIMKEIILSTNSSLKSVK